MMREQADLYLRLSREDGERDSESQSIRNQRDFLLDYCARKGFDVEDIYVDRDIRARTLTAPISSGFCRTSRPGGLRF